MLRSFWTLVAAGFTLAVIGLSMAMNFAFGHALGATPVSARILGALSVACDGLKALLPVLIAWQWSDRRYLAAASGAFLFVLLLGYGTASAIGFAAENRTAFTALRDNRNASQQDRAADLAAAAAQLSALPTHRLIPVIDAELAARRKDRLWDATDGCARATLPASREFCKATETLKGERAVAAAADGISARIERITSELRRARNEGAGADADPQARAIARLARIDASEVGTGLAYLLALTVEAISAFGLFAVTQGRRAPEAAAEAGQTWRITKAAPAPPVAASQPSRYRRAG